MTVMSMDDWIDLQPWREDQKEAARALVAERTRKNLNPPTVEEFDKFLADRDMLDSKHNPYIKAWEKEDKA